MRLLFRQRFFSWLDSYDIYDEEGNTVFSVQGKLSWGHRLELRDASGVYLGEVKERILTLLPRFELYTGDVYLGQIRKEFTLFRPVFTLECNDWTVRGDWFEWEYEVVDSLGRVIMTASKKLFQFTDTYALDVAYPEDALLCAMIVLAIDAAKCSDKK